MPEEYRETLIRLLRVHAGREIFEHHFGAVFGAVEDVKDQGYRYVPFTIAGFTLELLEALAVVGRHSYPDDVTFEGVHWREGFVHPRDAFGVLIHLGEQRPAP